MRGASGVAYLDSFKKDASKLDASTQRLIADCISVLLKDPIPGARRAHNLTPRGNKPTIYTVDLTPNKAYKLSFHMDGQVAVLRRVGTHKAIDRNC